MAHNNYNLKNTSADMAAIVIGANKPKNIRYNKVTVAFIEAGSNKLYNSQLLYGCIDKYWW